jgi:uncharacterized protein (TIGR00106 family)
MVLMEFAIFPSDKAGGLSDYVARCLDIIDKSGLKYRFSAMSTIIEGELPDVLAVVNACHEELAKDSARISILVRVDSKPGNSQSRMESKVSSVEKSLGRTLST